MLNYLSLITKTESFTMPIKSNILSQVRDVTWQSVLALLLFQLVGK